MKDKWTFINNSRWINSCNKCCNDCDKGYKDCKQHCCKVFVEIGFCGGCKHSD